MFKHIGFTIIELMVAITIVAVLASLAIFAHDQSIKRAHFRAMLESASKLALTQQEHRQQHGRYASSVTNQNNSNANTISFPDGNMYSVQITHADFRKYEAKLEAINADSLPDNCTSIVVINQQGFLKFQSFNHNGEETTNECIPS